VKKIVKVLVCLVFLSPVLAFSGGQLQPEPIPKQDETQPTYNQNIWSDFSKDLAELQKINTELEFMYNNLLSTGQPISKSDEEEAERKIKRALTIMQAIAEKYEDSFIQISGFAVVIPWAVEIDFSIDLEKLFQ